MGKLDVPDDLPCGQPDALSADHGDEEMVLVLEGASVSPGIDERIAEVVSKIQPRVWNTGVITMREPE